MAYRVCKSFEVESGHMLSKHPDRCRYPHGHSRRIELVISADQLDENDMVVDFKWIKLAVSSYIDDFDHALCVNASDPFLKMLQEVDRRVIVFHEGDPTTERMAERVFRHLDSQIRAKTTFKAENKVEYRLTNDIRLERVRVWETSSSWAEFVAEPSDFVG